MFFDCCTAQSNFSGDELSYPKQADTTDEPEPKFRRNRRAGVSAEAVTRERLENWEAKVFPKSAEDKAEIKKAIEKNLMVLFGHLDSESIDKIVDALELDVFEAGTDLIRQGDQGDYFYIVKTGNFDIFVTRNNDPPMKVASRGPGSFFGELALLYNAPRAATVRAVERSQVWKLDRNSFQMLLVSNHSSTAKRHEDMLERVELFRTLSKVEKGKVSDLLQLEVYHGGDRIIQQGSQGDKFFLLDEGSAVALLRGPKEGDEEVEVKRYQPGDYFGELALLNQGERKASVVAVADSDEQLVKVLSLSREDFDRVLGPIVDIMRERAGLYPTYAQVSAAGK